MKEKAQKREKAHQKLKSLHTNRVKRLSSIKAKVSFVLLFSIVLTIFMGLGTTIPSIWSNTASITENYMRDLTDSYGQILNQNLIVSAMNMSGERLGVTFGEAGLQGMETSYFYIINAEGNIIYHPNPDMLGKPVDIPAIVGIMEQIKEIEPGSAPEPGTIRYTYEGAAKRASYIIRR